MMPSHSASAAQAKQREYYSLTASSYDEAHSHENEFDFILLATFLRHLDISSVLDIGSGTGRAVLIAKDCRPDIKAIGIEPSPELRERGHAKGLSPLELISGDAQNLAFADNSFDMVCEFAALHHIPNSSRAVSEMIRVARRAVFISDVNNFGQGHRLVRIIKQAINSVGLWPLANVIKTRGRGYDYSEGDGVSYSYSVFNDLPQVQAACHRVYIFGEDKNPYRTSPCAIIIGIKR